MEFRIKKFTPHCVCIVFAGTKNGKKKAQLNCVNEEYAPI